MVNVLTEISIKCPLEKVADYAANPDNAPIWYVNIKSAEWQTPKPLALGSKVAFKAEFLGRTLAYVYEIVEWQAHAKLVMQTIDGPFPMETTYSWSAIDEQTTRMTLRNCGKPSGFSALFAPFMSMMMRRANKQDLRRLKEILEA